MGRKNKHTRYNLWNSAEFNQQMCAMLKNEIISMALNRYKWVNLPETCDARYLEITLISNGIATIGKPYTSDKWYSLAVGAWNTNPDMYGNPKAWTALGADGTQFNVSPYNGYFMYDNKLRVSIMPRIMLWVQELVDILMTMRQNRAHQKIPLIISGVQEKGFDLTNYVKQVAGGELMVIATDGINNIQAKALTPPNAMPFIGDKLWANYMNIWNQIYTGLGIDNLQFKSERMIEDEVTSQNDPTNLIALDGLTERRKCCDYLNSHFPEFRDNPISVVWNKDNISDNYDITHNMVEMLKLDKGDSNDNGTV